MATPELAAFDLAVVIVSTNEAHWIRPLLRSLSASLDKVSSDVVIVDNNSTDGVRDLIATEFGWARVIGSANHGFPHANNRALMEVSARYILLINPDTEILCGGFAEVLRRMDECPDVGLAGCRQVAPDGSVWPSMRRFPNGFRVLMEALGSEHWPGRLSRLGQRELDRGRYEQEFDLDWTSGSFMLIRQVALLSAGIMDERFFLYSDEVDLARRIKDAGWRVRHLPYMEIRHHAGKKGFNPRAEAQYAWSSRFYARKHFSPVHRVLYVGTLALRSLLRLALYILREPRDPEAVRATVRFLTTLLFMRKPPYQAPPPTAVRPPAT